MNIAISQVILRLILIKFGMVCSFLIYPNLHWQNFSKVAKARRRWQSQGPKFEKFIRSISNPNLGALLRFHITFCLKTPHCRRFSFRDHGGMQLEFYMLTSQPPVDHHGSLGVFWNRIFLRNARFQICLPTFLMAIDFLAKSIKRNLYFSS